MSDDKKASAMDRVREVEKTVGVKMNVRNEEEAEGLVQQAMNGLASFEKADRSFDCRDCGERFTPKADQWIFYNLCDGCFRPFDAQKMAGRLYNHFGYGEKPEHYFESCDQYLDWKRATRS